MRIFPSSLAQRALLLMLFAEFASGIVATAQDEKILPAPPWTDEMIAVEYARALALLSAGQIEQAAERVAGLRRVRPREPRLVHLERQIRLANSQPNEVRTGQAMKQRLKQITIPSVNFRQADPRDVFEFLRQQGEILATDHPPVNFVWNVPAQAPLPSITLQLRQVPMLDVVRYAAAMGGLQFRFEPHAVVVFHPAPTTVRDPGHPADHVQPE